MEGSKTRHDDTFYQRTEAVSGKAAAVAEIISVANEHRLAMDTFLQRPLYTRRHLQQAVCVCRRNKIVPNETLIAAGFNPYKETKEG